MIPFCDSMERVMATGHKLTLLGTGLIGTFYTMTLHCRRGIDRMHCVYSRTEERAKTFARENKIPKWTTDMVAAIEDADTDGMIIGLPNDLHVEASSANADLPYVILKTERLPDGRVKQVVKDKNTGEIRERIEN
jgi:hypothetical protein